MKEAAGRGERSVVYALEVDRDSDKSRNPSTSLSIP